MPVNFRIRIFSLFVSALVIVDGGFALGEEGRWEKEIATFEASDATQPPAKGGVLFVGSSSIRLWSLEKSFPDLPAINRGFGGSQVADSLRFADRIILPYAPRAIVIYAGDNDIASGKSPEEVAGDLEALRKKIREPLPESKIIYIGIKPSLARWEQVEKQREANRLIAAAAKGDERFTLIDVGPPMLGADGLPRKELFQADGLHLNDQGYELWTSLVRKALEE